MGGVAPPLYDALKGGSYFIHRIFYFFLMRKEVKNGMTIIYMTKEERWQLEKQICFSNFERTVECPLVNHCKWLLEWFDKNYRG